MHRPGQHRPKTETTLWNSVDDRNKNQNDDDNRYRGFSPGRETAVSSFRKENRPSLRCSSWARKPRHPDNISPHGPPERCTEHADRQRQPTLLNFTLRTSCPPTPCSLSTIPTSGFFLRQYPKPENLARPSISPFHFCHCFLPVIARQLRRGIPLLTYDRSQ